MQISPSKYIDKIPPIFRNVFFLSGTAFVFWMFFLDENNIPSQYKLYKELHYMESKKEFFKQEALKATAQYNAIMDDEGYVERYAREKYWMKKDNEDLYIVVNKESSK